jgi:hypothetical protein
MVSIISFISRSDCCKEDIPLIEMSASPAARPPRAALLRLRTVYENRSSFYRFIKQEDILLWIYIK